MPISSQTATTTFPISVFVITPAKFSYRVVFIGPRCTWGPIYGSRSLSLSKRRFADLTDVTLADKDINSILKLYRI